MNGPYFFSAEVAVLVGINDSKQVLDFLIDILHCEVTLHKCGKFVEVDKIVTVCIHKTNLRYKQSKNK